MPPEREIKDKEQKPKRRRGERITPVAPSTDPQSTAVLMDKWNQRKGGRRIPDESWVVFFEQLAKSGNIGKALEVVAISRIELYRRETQDPEFKKIFEEARSLGISAMEDEAQRRAVDGVSEPIFFQGLQIATVQKFSDQLLMFLLRGRKPEVFKERISTDNTNTNLNVPFTGLPDEELRKLIRQRLSTEE